MAAGAWSAVAVLAATVTNANPFRREGAVAEPRHFDPFQLLAHRPAGQAGAAVAGAGRAN